MAVSVQDPPCDFLDLHLRGFEEVYVKVGPDSHVVKMTFQQLFLEEHRIGRQWQCLRLSLVHIIRHQRGPPAP